MSSPSVRLMSGRRSGPHQLLLGQSGFANRMAKPHRARALAGQSCPRHDEQQCGADGLLEHACGHFSFQRSAMIDWIADIQKGESPVEGHGAFKVADSGRRGRGGHLGCWGTALVCNLLGRRIGLK